MKGLRQIIRQIAVNHVYRTSWYQNRRRKKTIGETGTQSMPPAEAARTITEIFEKYRREAGWSLEDVAGKSVLEIGPGELLGVALVFALHGAARVVAVDQFEEYTDTERTRAIAREIRPLVSELGQNNWNRFVDSQGRIILQGSTLTYLHDFEFETDRTTLSPPFDLICSNAVLEHVADMPSCFAQQTRLLGSGGIAVHQIDLRSHDNQNQSYPLEFLEYPEWLWNIMTNRMDGPNRLRVSDYEKLAGKYGFTVRGLRSTLDMPGEVAEQYRPRLTRRFKTSPLKDLTTESIVLCLQKIS